MSKATAATAADFIALCSISHGDREGTPHMFEPGDRIPAGLLPLATAERLERDLAIVRADSPEAAIIGIPQRCTVNPVNIAMRAVFVLARLPLRITTLSNIEVPVPAGALFIADTGTAGRAYRDGLVSPVDRTGVAGPPMSIRDDERLEVQAAWDLHGGEQFGSDLRGIVIAIERLPDALPPAKPIVLNLGRPEPPPNVPVLPRQFRTAD